MIIGYLAVCFAWIAVNYLMALFFFLLFVTFSMAGWVLIQIQKAGKLIRKPNGMVP